MAARLLIRPLLQKVDDHKGPPLDTDILELMMSRLFESPDQGSEYPACKKDCQPLPLPLLL